MKKSIIIATALFFSAGTFAQTTTPAAPVVKQEMKDLRKDVRNERQDKRQRRADLKTGNTAAAQSLTQDIKAQKTDIKSDARDLKADGVKHPIRKADRQIRRQNIRRRG